MKMPRNNSYLPFVLLTVPVLWLGVLAAGCYEEGMTVFDLMGCFNSALERPWQIVWMPYTLKAMLTALLLYGFALAMYFSAKENRRPGEEHGSAKWGSARELNAKYHFKPYHTHEAGRQKAPTQSAANYNWRQWQRQDSLFLQAEPDASKL